MLLLILAASQAPADELAEKSQQLEKLKARIDAVEADLADDRAREDALTGELRRREARIGELSAEIDDVNQRLKQSAARVAALASRYQAESERLSQQRGYLRRQIRAAYASGREEYLRLLLNQERPERLDRLLVYYDYFNRARGRRIRQAVAALQSLSRLREQLSAERESLAALRDRRGERLAALGRERDERRSVLVQLRQRIDERGNRLDTLREDAERVTQLIANLRQKLADIPDVDGGGQPFADRRGELGWPVDGPLLGRYGGERSGGVRWSGVLIGAKAGVEVHAVARGRVVFSDWLRGLGLLLIIDHGGGYLTLYGHNQSLYRDVGDWVEAGETVGIVGASGGRDRTGLYFEIRSGSDPVNPLAWLGPAATDSG